MLPQSRRDYYNLGLRSVSLTNPVNLRRETSCAEVRDVFPALFLPLLPLIWSSRERLKWRFLVRKSFSTRRIERPKFCICTFKRDIDKDVHPQLHNNFGGVARRKSYLLMSKIERRDWLFRKNICNKRLRYAFGGKVILVL